MQGRKLAVCAAIAAVGCTFEVEAVVPPEPDAAVVDPAPPDAAPFGTLCPGSFAVASVGDGERLAGCGAITGDLWIGGDEALVVSLPLLASIEGNLTVDGAHVVGLLAPRLESVAGSVIVRGSPRLRRLELARLGRVARDLLVVDATFVEHIDLRSLIWVGNVLQLENLAFAREIRLDSLREVGLLLRVAGNPTARAISFGALTRVGAAFLIVDNQSLAWLPGLESFERLGGSNAAGDLRIENNPIFPGCRAEAICDRLVRAGLDPARCVIAANDDDAECL